MELHLYGFQKEALDAILQYKRGIVVLPTGSGKTIIGVALLKYLQEHYDEVEYYILVPTIALVEQWYSVIRKYNVSTALGNIMTYATFVRRERSFGRTRIENVLKKNYTHVNVIIIDEAHHAHVGTELWNAISRLNPDYLVGFTATLNELKHYELPVIFKRTPAQLSEYIAQLELVKVPVELTPEDADAFKAYKRELASLFRKRERALAQGEMNQVNEIEIRIQSILGIIPYTVSDDPNVIDKTVELALKLYKETNDRILIKTQRKVSARTIRFGLLVKGVRKEDIILYESKKDIKCLSKPWRILITVKALSEGIDVPDLTYAILSSYDYRSTISAVQTIGRALRRTATKSKAVVYILVPNLNEYEEMYKKLLSYASGSK